MKNISVITNITAKNIYIKNIKEELLLLTKDSLLEEGCIQYDILQNNDNPAHFKIFEVWTEIKLWEFHMEKKHIQNYLITTNGMFDKFTTNNMTLINKC